jgi:hypothetical protein
MQNGIAGNLRSAAPTRGRQPTTLIERRGFGSLRIGWNWRDPRKTNCGAQVTARERDVSEANQYEIHTATRNVQPPLLLRSVLARQGFRKKQGGGIKFSLAARSWS